MAEFNVPLDALDEVDKKFDKTLLAAKHVLDARNFVDEQKARIARLKAAGADTQEAERTLELFDQSSNVRGPPGQTQSGKA